MSFAAQYLNAESASTWLIQHAARPNASLLSELRAEALRLERIDPNQALAVAKAVQTAADFWQDAATEALGQQLHANVELMLGQHAAAVERYAKAGNLYRELGQETEAAAVAVGHMVALHFLARFAEADRVADSAETSLQSTTHPDQQLILAKIWLNRGQGDARQGKLTRARRWFERAAERFTELDEHRYAAMTRANMAIVLIELNDFRAAEPALLNARTYFEAQGMSGAVARLDLNLAYLFASQGNTQQALQHYNAARQIYVEQANAPAVATVDLHRSDLYLTLNLWRETLDQVDSALPVFSEAAMPFEQGRLLLNRALTQQANDDSLSQARALFAQENNQVWVAVADWVAAQTLAQAKRWDAALTAATTARAVFAEQGILQRVAQCDLLLGEIALAQGLLDSAEIAFQQAIAPFDNTPPLQIRYLASYGAARIALARDDRTAALTTLRVAVNDIEQLQATIGAEQYKIAFFSDKLAIYEALVQLCLQIDTPTSHAEAFATVERAKSRALLDTVARAESTANLAADSAVLNSELKQLRDELNWYYNRLNAPDDEGQLRRTDVTWTQAITEREQAVARVLQQLRQPDLTPTPDAPIWAASAEQIQATLPPDTTLVTYYLVGEQFVAFVLSAETLTITQLPISPAQLTTQLQQLRFQLGKFSYGRRIQQTYAALFKRSCDHALQQLYKTFWQPLHITTTNVTIVAHGQLHALPFHALYSGEQYLADRHTLAYAPSATLIHHLWCQQPADSETNNALIVGVADKTIPAAESEARAIAELLGDSAELRTGNAATFAPSLFAQQPYRLLHLASHATFRRDNPRFSAFKLADRWITAAELTTASTTPRFVTLSACETGQHHVTGGDELLGLSRGFLAAGTQLLLVSLWQVNDEATAQLMQHYYRRLRAGQPANVALRQAQQMLRQQYDHPYFWAAFVLIGHADLTL